MNTKTIYGAIAVTFIVAVLALFMGFHSGTYAPVSSGFGAAATSTTTHYPSLSTANLVVGETCDTDYGTCNGTSFHVTSASCNTASSTLFAVKPPFAGTSTALFTTITGTTAATTTDIVVGTSTTPALALTAATTTLNSNYFGVGSIASSTAFTISSVSVASRVPLLNGAAAAIYSNFNSAITVGPNEFLLGFATSTYVGASTGTGGAQTAAVLPAPTSCTYEILWVR